MRVALALLIGLTLGLATRAGAADSAPGSWSAEVEPDVGRMVLVWSAPTRAALALKDGIARIRAPRPIAEPPPSVTAPLAPWLLAAAARGRGAELVLALQSGVVATLRQPEPRLTVIEFSRAAPPFASTAADSPVALEYAGSTPERSPAALAAVAPAAGPVRAIPIPRPRPEPEPEREPEPTVTPLQAVAVAPEQSGPMPVAGPEPAQAVTVSADAHAGGLELRFRWVQPVPAAVFEHGQQLWVAFPGADASVAGWRSLARPETAAWLEPIASASMGGARVFRFRLNRSATVEAHATGPLWTISVTAPPAQPLASSPARELQRTAAPGALVADTDGQVVQLRDPGSGERLGLLISPEGGPLQREPARLVDLELLPSIQGLIWRVQADGLQAAVIAGRLTITRPGGLRLSLAEVPKDGAVGSTARLERENRQRSAPQESPDMNTAASGEIAPTEAVTPPAALRPAPAATVPAGPLGLTALAGMDSGGRQAARERLIGDLPTLSGLPRAEARLQLARLFLADALGPEAGTALELIGTDIAVPAAGPLRTSRTAMAGAADALVGRQDPALAQLLDHSLDQDLEVALWRAYAAARASRWQLATHEWGRSGDILESYPGPLRRRLGLELAAALLDHGDGTETRSLLAQLDGQVLGTEDRARLRLLQGIAHGRDAMVEKAEADFAAAEKASDPDIAARAAFLLTSSQIERGAMTPEQGAAALTAQRSDWRGHPWEGRMLMRLAAMEAAVGRPGDAVSAWQAAIQHTPEQDLANLARSELRRYLVGQLTDLGTPPVARLVLYRAHGAILDGDPGTPALRAGLAEAAAAAGLTETADTLLDKATPTQEGELALADALAGQGDFEGALKRLAGATPAAGDRRAELRARMQLAAGEPAKARVALGQSQAAGALSLAREAAWRLGDWLDVAGTAGTDLAEAKDATLLNSPRADAAVWLGLAQAQLGRTADAADVTARYAGRIMDQEAAALLRLATITAPTAGTGDEVAATAGFAGALLESLQTLPPLAVATRPADTRAFSR